MHPPHRVCPSPKNRTTRAGNRFRPCLLCTTRRSPCWGRLRTNYPALVFVLLGFSLIFYVVGTMPPKPVKWLVEGRFIAKKPKMIWHLDKLSIHPCDFTPSMDNGKFTISLELGEGVTGLEIGQLVAVSPSRPCRRRRRIRPGIPLRHRQWMPFLQSPCQWRRL